MLTRVTKVLGPRGDDVQRVGDWYKSGVVDNVIPVRRPAIDQLAKTSDSLEMVLYWTKDR